MKFICDRSPGRRFPLRRLTPFAVYAALLIWLFCGATLSAADEDRLVDVTFEDADGTVRSTGGRVLVEALDGGILLEGRDGRLWNVTPDKLRSRRNTETEFKPFSPEELGNRLHSELGEGFNVYVTPHYVICSNTGTEYARWCGTLFERLQAAFESHWKGGRFELHPPEFPLAAIIFANQSQFAEFAKRDARTETAPNSKGYYSIPTNRIVLYDLTAGTNESPARSADDINRRLAASLLSVATVVHEATHQIAFNAGMHQRMADNPLWLTEGMAMYFETPDLKSRTGWRTAGAVNRHRLAQFKNYARSGRPADSLRTLVSSDARFLDPKQKPAAYAEAWALSYFLIKTRRKAYLEYLETIAKKPRLFWDSPEKRLTEFQAAFGEDIDRIDRAFLKYAGRLGR